jgi:hypothetical protein
MKWFLTSNYASEFITVRSFTVKICFFVFSIHLKLRARSLLTTKQTNSKLLLLWHNYDGKSSLLLVPYPYLQYILDTLFQPLRSAALYNVLCLLFSVFRAFCALLFACCTLFRVPVILSAAHDARTLVCACGTHTLPCLWQTLSSVPVILCSVHGVQCSLHVIDTLLRTRYTLFFTQCTPFRACADCSVPVIHSSVHNAPCSVLVGHFSVPDMLCSEPDVLCSVPDMLCSVPVGHCSMSWSNEHAHCTYGWLGGEGGRGFKLAGYFAMNTKSVV